MKNGNVGQINYSAIFLRMVQSCIYRKQTG